MKDFSDLPERGTPPVGRLTLIGAGPGAKDLLTLRAVSRLRDADVICYDRLVEAEVLDLARPDARRIFVGKEVGACAWPQDKINALAVAEAMRGHHVVRLKSGDPGVFGRAAEEIAAARLAGVPVEVVPGVTAACAAAASARVSLTERGVTDTLVLSTATGMDGEALEGASRLTSPGTSTAFYMAARKAADIQAALLARGLPQDAPVTVAVDVSKPTERVVQMELGALAETMVKSSIRGCAIILVTWPKIGAEPQAAVLGEATCAGAPAAI